jgi:hypothetical protein
VYEEVPTAPTLESGHTLLTKPIDGFGLCPGRNLKVLGTSVEERNFNVDTKRRFGEANVDAVMEIVSDPLISGVITHGDINEHIPGLRSSLTGPTFAAKPQPGPCVYAWWDLDSKCSGTSRAAFARTRHARMLDTFARSRTIGAVCDGHHCSKKGLASGLHPAAASTGATRYGVVTRFGA